MLDSPSREKIAAFSEGIGPIEKSPTHWEAAEALGQIC
jgi:hypothetical protein